MNYSILLPPEKIRPVRCSLPVTNCSLLGCSNQTGYVYLLLSDSGLHRWSLYAGLSSDPNTWSCLVERNEETLEGQDLACLCEGAMSADGKQIGLIVWNERNWEEDPLLYFYLFDVLTNQLQSWRLPGRTSAVGLLSDTTLGWLTLSFGATAAGPGPVTTSNFVHKLLVDEALDGQCRSRFISTCPDNPKTYFNWHIAFEHIYVAEQRTISVLNLTDLNAGWKQFESPDVFGALYSVGSRLFTTERNPQQAVLHRVRFIEDRRTATIGLESSARIGLPPTWHGARWRFCQKPLALGHNRFFGVSCTARGEIYLSTASFRLPKALKEFCSLKIQHTIAAKQIIHYNVSARLISSELNKMIETEEVGESEATVIEKPVSNKEFQILIGCARSNMLVFT